MTRSKVNALLFVSILVMALCPMLCALYFVDRALVTSLNLGFNEQVSDALESSAESLKRLGRLDAERRDEYHAEFERVQNLKAIYSSRDVIKQSLRHSLLIYFGVGVLAALIASISVAALLSRRISKSYRVTFDELIKSRERMRYLEELSSWQELAKMLAHEIKNPLTPIEVLVTSLRKGHREQSTLAFADQLVQTEVMVLEELSHLKDVVAKFSGFARLPSVQLMETDLPQLLNQQVKAIDLMFESARMNLSKSDGSTRMRVNMDATLFRQALVNIVRNGVEANSDRIVVFKVDIEMHADVVQVRISNDGALPPQELTSKMFDPYISGKANKENVGLGLAIVRKIILEHGGDVVYRERAGCPEFIITLPRVA